MNDWLIYRGTGQPHDGIDRLPGPPPWRNFDGQPVVASPAAIDTASTRRLGLQQDLAEQFRPGHTELELINAALYLRRPLLVTGEPGSGKSTLAHAVAHELKLGRVLRWPIVSRTVLRDGLYQYDALARLQDLQLARTAHPVQRVPPGPETEDVPPPGDGIGRYVRLGPLGTALLAAAKPRVLLVDELDKSDIDLPNDLLNALEEGEFAIPELERIADRHPVVEVQDDDGGRVPVQGGRIRCRAFPFVVLTSNGERDFPAPLLRRCIHLRLDTPDEERLAAMVRAHFGPGAAEHNRVIIQRFLDRAPGEQRCADQLLNAIYLTQRAHDEDAGTRERLADQLMRPLNRGR
ncbi:MoxR family ATPase [Streptomyces sp. SL13]|uniref:MoxR family ATPase n=1 Tax=Streptantibioticus silvisoli TaxID=2705255 RepID=A0AA90KGL0_9ACTN|nr:MoxR family ATPase [Streptantibioticus silvisoli]MDI5966484.1 MoxR family ATPase [Streptantibioticus silvisoli]MDI5970334.1 MoxR family ATPase [Streptantibioticus silvisoli]